MRFDINKIDDRIRKLQEVREFASDPEKVKALLEFLTLDEGSDESSPAAAPQAPMEIPAGRETASNGHGSSEIEDIVAGVLEATGSPDHNGKDGRSVFFSRKRL